MAFHGVIPWQQAANQNDVKCEEGFWNEIAKHAYLKNDLGSTACEVHLLNPNRSSNIISVVTRQLIPIVIVIVMIILIDLPWRRQDDNSGELFQWYPT